MIAFVWTLITTIATLAVAYVLFLIAQKLVHFFARLFGVAAFKLHDKLQETETKEAIREEWGKTKKTVSNAAAVVTKKIKR